MNPELSYAYALDIAKSERDANGDLIVYGKATGSDVDLDGDRCDPAWLKEAMPAWMEWGNLREMHQPVLAGIGLELTQDGDDWHVKSKVIDEGVAKKVEAGGYKGYSIGIKGGVREKREGQAWITGGDIVEVSYVDRPCNPTAKIAIAKAAGADWSPAEEPAEEPVERKAAELDPRDRLLAETFIQKAADAAASGAQSGDIAGAKEAIASICRLIMSEAQQLAGGDLGEISDLRTLMDAVSSLRWYIRSEEHEAAGDDDAMHDYLAARATTNKSALGAKEDAMSDEQTPKTPEADEQKAAGAAEGKAAEGTTETTSVEEIVKAAVTKANEASEERIKALEAQLAEVMKAPVPGGPVLMQAPTGAQQGASISKAAEMRAIAENADPAVRGDYLALAEKYEKQGQ